MGRTGPARKRSSAACPSRDDSAPNRSEVGRLLRSAVCRRLPLRTRTRLDILIFQRRKGLETLESIFEHCRLERFGISINALKSYARLLEHLARPIATGQILAVVFGRLTPAHRRRLLAGTQVLLLSRVAQALSSHSQGLSVADLSRLGTLLAALGRLPRDPDAERKGASDKHASALRLTGAPQPQHLAELIHSIYGLRLQHEKSEP